MEMAARTEAGKKKRYQNRDDRKAMTSEKGKEDDNHRILNRGGKPNNALPKEKSG
jgi:hypothetical protein